MKDEWHLFSDELSDDSVHGIARDQDDSDEEPEQDQDGSENDEMPMSNE